MEFEGRTAFITGGARGIGLGIARALARHGTKLVLVDVDAGALDAAEAELADRTPTATFVLDVRDRERYGDVADEAERRLGPITLLFNNAGVTTEPPVTEMTYEMWDWMLDINLNGVVNGIQTFLPRMLARGGDAHIVNTASGAGLVVVGAGVMYTTSKFAVVGMSEALRNGLAKHGIGVSVLCPAYVATDIVENSASLRPPDPDTAGGTTSNVTARLEQTRATMTKGVPIDAVGEIVLSGIRDGRLYIYTDDMIGTFLERRQQELIDALTAVPS